MALPQPTAAVPVPSLGKRGGKVINGLHNGPFNAIYLIILHYQHHEKIDIFQNVFFSM